MKTPALYLAIKQFLIQASFHTGLTHVLHHTWPAGHHDGTILIYHSVSHGIDYPFIPSQMRVSPAHFEEQIAYLARHCHVVALTELGTAIRTGSCLPFRTVALTFDDGFKDNLTHALPTLLRYGLTATFFVVSGWVGAQRLSWLHRLYYLVWLGPAADVLADFLSELRSLDRSVEIESSLLESHRPLGALRHLLLDEVTPAESEEIVDRVWKRRAVMSARDERELAARLYLSWDDVDQLNHAGMGVGGHTLSHPKLARLFKAAAEEEVIQSHKALEDRLHTRITTFSYPFGWPDSFNDRCRQVLEQVGVEVACALVGESGRPGQDPLSLGRLPAEDVSLAEFALEITGLPGGLRMARSGFRAFWSRG